jgi:hypothetical protein
MKRLRAIGLIVFLFLVAVVGALFYKTHQKVVYRTFISPDGKYEMIVYRYESIMSLPGQGSDASGLVRLYDLSSGRRINQCKIEMVQLVDRCEWSQTNVSIPLIVDWSFAGKGLRFP